jgi:hypothetical protein
LCLTAFAAASRNESFLHTIPKLFINNGFVLAGPGFVFVADQRGIDICHETVRYWWNRFGPMFAKEIRKKRIHPVPNYSNWKWHLDEVFVKINGETHYLWRAVDHEGEV